jgi:hypothetical protein
VRSSVHHVPAPRGNQGRVVGPRHRTRATATGAITDLQRTIGNRAVCRMLLGAGPLVVQRDDTSKKPPPKKQQPPPRAKGEYGLDIAANQTTYVTQAVNLWKTRKTMPLKDFATTLLQTIDTELKAYGVPLFNWVFDTNLGANGQFDSEHWTLKVNPDKFGDPNAATVGDLNPEEVRDTVGTLYHEARHTDQDVLLVRVLREQKKSEAEIVATTKIDAAAVKAISAATFKDPLDDEQRAHAGRMFDVMYGAHNELISFLMAHPDAFAGLVDLADPTSTISAAAPHITTFSGWQTSTLKPKIDALRAMKKRSTAEETLLKDLRAVDAALTALFARWSRLPAGKAPKRTDADAIRALAKAAKDRVFAAQLHLEGEKDAYRVEGKIKSALKAAGVK